MFLDGVFTERIEVVYYVSTGPVVKPGTAENTSGANAKKDDTRKSVAGGPDASIPPPKAEAEGDQLASGASCALGALTGTVGNAGGGISVTQNMKKMQTASAASVLNKT